MTTLTHLHEPGVVWNLEARYAQGDIYTNTGSILIAVNPFRPIPRLFTPEVLAHYSKGTAEASMASARGLKSTSKRQRHMEAGSLSPHVYNVACNAYHQMLRDAAGQAILVRQCARTYTHSHLIAFSHLEHAHTLVLPAHACT